MIKKLFGLGWSATKATVRISADVLKVTKDVVVDNKGLIASGTSAAVKAVGTTTKVVGRGVAVAAGAAADLASEAGDGKSGAARLGLKTASALARGVEAAGKGTEYLGRGVESAAKPIGDATGGAAAGGAAILSESTDGLVLSRREIEDRRRELVSLGESLRDRGEERLRTVRRLQRDRRKSELLDNLVVGGVTLASIVSKPSSVPPEVEEAFAAAYPGLAQQETFAEAVARMSPDELPGLVAGVKGKLFELQFVEALNNGGLPDGYEATLAGSANQAGWDIQILGPDGQVVEVLQAKATESVAYVQAALEKYPGIEVTTTSEVYAQMAALGAAEGVRDSGISEASLEAMVSNASGTADAGLDAFTPSVLGLAVIALSVFVDPSVSREQRASLFGERSGRAGVSTAAGHLVMVATQTWWLGLIGGVGTHWLAAKGRSKREQLECLDGLIDDLKALEARQALLPRPT